MDCSKYLLLFITVALLGLIVYSLNKSKKDGFANIPEVDLVYTWVSGKDPAFNDLREKMRSFAEGESIGQTEHFNNVSELFAETSSALQSAYRYAFQGKNYCNRLSSVEEILYSIRSVKKNMPWIRNIYVVLPKSNIPFFPRTSAKVNLVSQESLLQKHTSNVSFNSNAIECLLDEIPGLSENFVYMNDDVFIRKKVKFEDLYSDGKIVVIPQTFFGKGISSYLSSTIFPFENTTASRNNCDSIINEIIGEDKPTYELISHAPILIRKSVYADLKSRIAKHVKRTLKSPFRTQNDMVLPHYIYPHYCLETGLAKWSRDTDIKEIRWTDVMSVNDQSIKIIKSLGEKYKYLLINDERGSCEQETSDQLTTFLKEIF